MLLDRLILCVSSPETLARFYVERLGMTLQTSNDGIVVGYGGEGAAIELRPANAGDLYAHRRQDRYWKIGITLPNIDIAFSQLRDAGVSVTEPRQFGQIGYMCHLGDPEGFQIELLQHDFERNRSADAGDQDVPLGGGAQIGQVTFRAATLEAALAFYRDGLGMTLLSVQPVSDYGFTLYFLAFTDESPPCDDLGAIGNREWLWRRPYTTIELQHFGDVAADFSLPEAGASGFAGLVIKGADAKAGMLVDDGGASVQLLP